MSDVSEAYGCNCRRSDNAADSPDCHLFPTVSKVDVQNSSPWRDSGSTVQLAFMCALEVIRRDNQYEGKKGGMATL
jgi:hypothetical protein